MVPTANEVNETPDGDAVFYETIDPLASRFEENWTKESIFRLDEILRDIPEAMKEKARTELFALDFEISFKKSRRVEPADYFRLFPRYEASITEAYEQLMATRKLEGGYEYFELIGKGGMGNVFRGRHELLDRQHAIKILNRKMLDRNGGTERFRREIRLCGKLSHTNIVKAENAGKKDDRHFLVMELIDGEDLGKIVEHAGPLPLPLACEILRQAATGLQYAFEKGFIHRDIKPGNLMISRDGVVKIIDFGLGKYVAGDRDLDRSLTVYGSAMGSVDYMSPEQLLDAASATIRSDIFSLGCVFFFLLVGQAPLDYLSLEKKRKTIADGEFEMPSLSRFIMDIPTEVEEFYQNMVAVDPEARFDRPSEIIDFTTPFADPEGLPSLLSPSSSGDIGNSAFSSGVRPPTPETSVYPPKNESPLPKRSADGATDKAISGVWPRLKRHGSKVWLLLLVGFGLYLYGTMQRPEVATPFSKEKAQIVQTETASVKPEIAADILQFPGYSGKWWFEEIPWLLPSLREKLAASETSLSGLTTDGVLPVVSRESEATRRLVEFLIRDGKTTMKNVADFEILADRYLTEAATVNPRSAPVLHTQAVLLHRLSILRSEPELERHALDFYDRALQSYDAEPSETSRLLSNLCKFDLARLNYGISGRAEEFQRHVNGIVSGDGDDMLFRVHLLAVPALEQMKSGQQQDVVLEESFKLLEKLGSESTPHPMQPKLHLLYAAALTRQWRLEAAEQQWKKAEKPAVQLAIRSGASEREARLCTDVVCAKLSCASACRYFGDLNAARYHYRDLIGNLQDALDYLSPGETEAARLTRQLAESWEGLADTTLFVPSHFVKGLIPNALFFLGEAESGYRQALELSEDPAVRFVLKCKLALLRLGSGDIDEVERKEQAEGIREAFWKLSPLEDGSRRARDYNNLVEAVWAAPDDLKPIRTYLDQRRLNHDFYERYAGERLDLQLFAIRSLLSSELETDFPAAQQDTKQYLDPILLQHLSSARKMRPFLLPFYDLAIRSPQDDDFVQITARIWMSRCRRYSDQLSKNQLTFYFPLGEDEGFALFLSPDLNENRRFALGVNRQQLLDAARNGKTLPLSPELVERVRAVWKQSETVDISWDDSVCWGPSQSKNRLTLENWIFDVDLDLHRSLGIIR